MLQSNLLIPLGAAAQTLESVQRGSRLLLEPISLRNPESRLNSGLSGFCHET